MKVIDTKPNNINTKQRFFLFFLSYFLLIKFYSLLLNKQESNKTLEVPI